MSKESESKSIKNELAELPESEAALGAAETENQASGKKEPGGTTTGMLHRAPSKDCPICELWGVPWDENNPDTWGKQHIDAERLWNEWNPQDKRARWVGEMIELLKEDYKIIVDEKTVKDHFGKNHKIEQPMLSEKLDHESALYEVQQLPEISRQIIESVYRQKVLLTRQVIEVFYKESRSEKTAMNNGTVALNTLASNWYLYRYMPSKEDVAKKGTLPNFSRSSVWFLGKKSVPYIQETYEIAQKFYPHFLNRARDIDANNLVHDLRANEIFVAMKAQTNKMEAGKKWERGRAGIHTRLAGDLEINLFPENWYGPGINLLPLGYVDPSTGAEQRLLPDGFASISVGHSSQGMPSTQLPFFIEYDNGSKTISEAAEQLLAYHLMGISGASKKRFPQLDVDNYIIPVLMVFNNKTRVKSVAAAFREKAKEKGLESGAPLYLANFDSWTKSPFSDEIVVSAWDDTHKQQPFIDSLILSSKPLIESGNTNADTILERDPKSATANSHFKKTGDNRPAKIAPILQKPLDEPITSAETKIKDAIAPLPAEPEVKENKPEESEVGMWQTKETPAEETTTPEGEEEALINWGSPGENETNQEDSPDDNNQAESAFASEENTQPDSGITDDRNDLSNNSLANSPEEPETSMPDPATETEPGPVRPEDKLDNSIENITKAIQEMKDSGADPQVLELQYKLLENKMKELAGIIGITPESGISDKGTVEVSEPVVSSDDIKAAAPESPEDSQPEEPEELSIDDYDFDDTSDLPEADLPEELPETGVRDPELTEAVESDPLFDEDDDDDEIDLEEFLSEIPDEEFEPDSELPEEDHITPEALPVAGADLSETESPVEDLPAPPYESNSFETLDKKDFPELGEEPAETPNFLSDAAEEPHSIPNLVLPKQEETNPELAPFNKHDPLAANNLTEVAGSPEYEKEEVIPESDLNDINFDNIPADSPLRKQHAQEQQLINDAVVAPAAPVQPIQQPVSEAPVAPAPAPPAQPQPEAPPQAFPEINQPAAPAPEAPPQAPVQPPTAQPFEEIPSAPVSPTREPEAPVSPPPAEPEAYPAPPSQPDAPPPSSVNHESETASPSGNQPPASDSGYNIGGVNEEIEAKMNQSAAKRRARRRRQGI